MVISLTLTNAVPNSGVASPSQASFPKSSLHCANDRLVDTGWVWQMWSLVEETDPLKWLWSKQPSIKSGCLGEGLGSNLSAGSWSHPLSRPGPPTSLSSPAPVWHLVTLLSTLLLRSLVGPPCKTLLALPSSSSHSMVWQVHRIHASVLILVENATYLQYCFLSCKLENEGLGGSDSKMWGLSSLEHTGSLLDPGVGRKELFDCIPSLLASYTWFVPVQHLRSARLLDTFSLISWSNWHELITIFCLRAKLFLKIA